MKPHKLEGTLGYALLTLMAVTVIVPFVSILFAAVQPAGSPVSGLAWPHEWHWENLGKAWSAAGFGGLIANSFVIALTVVPLAVVMSTLAGYALGSLRVRGGKLVFTFFLLGLTLPVELIVVPLYYDLRSPGLTNSYWGVTLAETAVFLPFGVFWMRTHFESVPESLGEAASIDGALAGAGEPHAAALQEDAARALADLALLVNGRLGLAGPVVLAGGVLIHQPVLRERVRTLLAGRGIADVRALRRPPVWGALALADALLTNPTAPQEGR